jgi:hypothetical protein
MNRFFRSPILLTGVLGALLAAASLVRSTGPRQPNEEFWSLAAWDREMQQEARHEADLNARDREIVQRLRQKETAIQKLIDGQATLAEVADEFRSLSGHEPYYWGQLEHTYPSASEEERVWRNVIDYTGQALLYRPEPLRLAVRARLEAELRDRLSKTEKVPAGQ